MAAFPHAVLAERSFSQRFRDTFDVVTPEGHCISVLQRRPALELEAAEDELLSQNKIKSDALDTGCTVWDAAALLADFLMHSKYFDGFYYPNVLELGAGTGLVGLVAACCLDCDTILLTDLPRICEKVLRPNIVRNGFLQASLGRRVTCASLEWGRSPGKPRRHTDGANIKEDGSAGTSTTSLRFLDDGDSWRPDLCLCADLVYTHEHAELLLATLADLFHQNPDLYVVWAQNGSHAPLAWREALLGLKKLYEVENLWPAFRRRGGRGCSSVVVEDERIENASSRLDLIGIRLRAEGEDLPTRADAGCDLTDAHFLRGRIDGAGVAAPKQSSSDSHRFRKVDR